MKNRIVIVVSDLHISSGPLDDFDSEIEDRFCDFLAKLSSRNSPVELVLNGDAFDFVQAEPWQGAALRSSSPEKIPLCCTEQQSLQKLDTICQAHSKVMKGFGKFLQSKDLNRLTVLPGNHDVDFFWPKVRASFLTRLEVPPGSQKVNFHLEEFYHPPSYPQAWIGHGHQFDQCNSFHLDGKACWSNARQPIFKDHEGTERLFECLGTRFLNKFINDLDAEYPFVDNVKPFSRFLRIFGASAFAPRYGPLKATVAMYGMLKFLSTTLVTKPSDLLDNCSPKIPDPRPFLMNMAHTLTKEEQQKFLLDLERAGFHLSVPLDMYVADVNRAGKLMDFLASHPEIIPAYNYDESAYLDATGSKDYLDLTRGFYVDETKTLINESKKIKKENNSELVIMGHTHATVDQVRVGGYMNTGCWTRYYHSADDEKLCAWSILKTDSYRIFPYRLTYAELVPGHTSPAQLMTFRERCDDLG